jgi:hypothetical protein
VAKRNAGRSSHYRVVKHVSPLCRGTEPRHELETPPSLETVAHGHFAVWNAIFDVSRATLHEARDAAAFCFDAASLTAGRNASLLSQRDPCARSHVILS